MRNLELTVQTRPSRVKATPSIGHNDSINQSAAGAGGDGQQDKPLSALTTPKAIEAANTQRRARSTRASSPIATAPVGRSRSSTNNASTSAAQASVNVNANAVNAIGAHSTAGITGEQVDESACPSSKLRGKSVAPKVRR
jgi:hypothetical protein